MESTEEEERRWAGIEGRMGTQKSEKEAVMA